MLRQIKLPGVKLIKERAFWSCCGLEDAEFGDKLERIDFCGFQHCTSLRSTAMTSIWTHERCAFHDSTALTDAEFGDEL
jgi:hypothetical protein